MIFCGFRLSTASSPLVDQVMISDYYAIGEQFGTMEEFDELIAETKKRNMYVLMDLVVNHCSSEHEWFKKAMADPDGEYGDYFYIRESKDGQPINNARSISAAISGNRFPARINTISICSSQGTAGPQLGKSKGPSGNLQNGQLVAGQRAGRFSN